MFQYTLADGKAINNQIDGIAWLQAVADGGRRLSDKVTSNNPSLPFSILYLRSSLCSTSRLRSNRVHLKSQFDNVPLGRWL